jgi:membrane associated rhomboid family serine protease
VFIPTGDTPNPRHFTPWVTWALIGANVAAYLLINLPLDRPADPADPALMDYLRAILPHLPRGISPDAILASTSAYDLFVFQHGYKPGAPALDDLFASLFLHANIIHLAGNMLFLWIFGDNVEHRLGRIGHVVTYLFTGVAATLFFSLFAGGSMVPLVGASGAISGVLGLYFILFPRNRVKVFIAFFPFFFDVVLLPARWVLGFYLIVDNLLPFLIGAESGVAYGAHLGGFIAGLGIAHAGERLAWQWPWAGRLARAEETEDETEDEERRPAAAETLRAAMAAGDSRAALEAAGRIEEGDLDGLTPRECAVLAGWMEEAGYPAAASRLLRRCLARRANPSDLAEVYLQLGLLRLRQGQVAAAYQHLLDALDNDPPPETAARAREALDRIDVYRRRTARGEDD